MSTETIEIQAGSDDAVAHVDRVILATASRVSVRTSGRTDDQWLIQLRNGISHFVLDRDTAIAALRTIKGPIPAGVETLCEDTTCCLDCEDGGEHHDAGECWIEGDNVVGATQCPCDRYHPALTAHRHLAPAQIGAGA